MGTVGWREKINAPVAASRTTTATSVPNLMLVKRWLSRTATRLFKAAEPAMRTAGGSGSGIGRSDGGGWLGPSVVADGVAAGDGEIGVVWGIVEALDVAPGTCEMPGVGATEVSASAGTANLAITATLKVATAQPVAKGPIPPSCDRPIRWPTAGFTA